jgi:hypothetical protein
MEEKSFRDLVLAKLAEYEEASPVGKITIIVQLRYAFDHCRIDEGLSAIDACHEEKQLGILLGVGMRGAFYYAVVRRRGEILGL